ncbi:hypothetical protein QUA00_27600 [Microcoleus sp. T2B6]|uniref:hypothetical protein n=1 Tax=Microcoleus sp. T2B6 TaxID=3055424 RepID=UPI002FD4CAC8
MGNGEWGMGHRAWGIGHRASGIGNWASGIGNWLLVVIANNSQKTYKKQQIATNNQQITND